LAGGNAGASEQLVQDMRRTAGVATVTTLRTTPGRINESPAQLVGIDPVQYPKVATFEFSEGGQTSDIAKLEKGRGLIANGVFAAQNLLHVGDQVRVTVNVTRHTGWSRSDPTT
jgi:hypothetical protein